MIYFSPDAAAGGAKVGLSELAAEAFEAVGIGNLRLQHFAYAVPIVIVIAWMLMHEDLGTVAQILTLCMSLVFLAAFFAYSDFDAAENKLQKKQLAAITLFEKESLEETYARLSAGILDAQESLTIILFLKKKIHDDNKNARCLAAANKNARKSAVGSNSSNSNNSVTATAATTVAVGGLALRMLKCGAVQQCILLLLSVHYTDKRTVACLDLLNEILSNKSAQHSLLVAAATADMRDVVDSFIEWFESLCNAYMNISDSNNNSSSSSRYGAVGDSFLGSKTNNSNNNSSSASNSSNSSSSNSSAAVDAAQQVDFDAPHWNQCCAKAMLSLGLFCDDITAVQTRVADRGVIRITADSVLQQREAVKDAALIKWTLWLLFNLTLSHPANKSELLSSNGLVLVVDALKRHSSDKDVTRQALALLYSLISPDDRVKYSLARTRQALMANGIVDLLEEGRAAFRMESDIIATSKAILNLVAADFS